MDPAGYEDSLSLPQPPLVKSKTVIAHNCDRYCKHQTANNKHWYVDKEFMDKERELYEEMALLSDEEISSAALDIKKKKSSYSKYYFISDLDRN